GPAGRHGLQGGGASGWRALDMRAIELQQSALAVVARIVPGCRATWAGGAADGGQSVLAAQDGCAEAGCLPAGLRDDGQAVLPWPGRLRIAQVDFSGLAVGWPADRQYGAALGVVGPGVEAMPVFLPGIGNADAGEC